MGNAQLQINADMVGLSKKTGFRIFIEVCRVLIRLDNLFHTDGVIFNVAMA
jgi:hypothetical protein